MKKIANKDFFTWVEEELSAGRTVRFRVKGSSMYPLLRDGIDEVALRQYPPEQLQKGDIVLFTYHGQHILHRFIARKNGDLLIRGDNLLGKKESCTTEELLGIVISIYRRKNAGSTFFYQTISPHSLTWRVIVFIWRIARRVRNR